MAAWLESAKGTFWSESFWLIGNVTWNDLKNTEGGIYHAELKDLWVTVYLAVFVSIAIVLFERYIAESIGRWFGLKSVVKKAAPNPLLEQAFKKKKSPSDDTIKQLAKQTDQTVRQVERWFRIRRNQDRTPILKKFIESAWRCFFYGIIFIYGLYIHWDKSWFWDQKDCWRGWPHHHITDDVYWYYAIEGGFYISLLCSLFKDHKRKDFTEMIVHHFATILLMLLSWINNFFRIGTLVLLVHDAVDSWMEAAKMAKYVGHDNVCELLFTIFMLMWVVTRMTIYPFWIIYTVMFDSVEIMGDVSLLNIYYVYNILLSILQVLHIIWFYYICLIAYDAFFVGKVEKDSRSSLESASDSATEEGKDEQSNGPAPHEPNGVVQRTRTRKTT